MNTPMLLSIQINPKVQSITIDLLGKRSVLLTPADARDVIRILDRGLKECDPGCEEGEFMKNDMEELDERIKLLEAKMKIELPALFLLGVIAGFILGRFL